MYSIHILLRCFFCSVFAFKKNNFYFLLVLVDRYEQGLEDYEEAVARVDKLKEQQQQSFGLRGLETVLSFIETASDVWNKVSSESSNGNSNSSARSYKGWNEQPTMTLPYPNDRQTTNDFTSTINGMYRCNV